MTTVTSQETCSHGLGNQLKTTHTILALMLIWSNICATNWERWEEVSVSLRAAPRHLDAILLLGTHTQRFPSVLACVPQDGTIHITPPSMITVSLCAQRAATSSHPTGQHTVGAQTSCLATKTATGSHRRNYAWATITRRYLKTSTCTNIFSLSHATLVHGKYSLFYLVTYVGE